MAQNQKPTVVEEPKKENKMAVIDPTKYATQDFNKEQNQQKVSKKLTSGKKFMVPCGAAFKMLNNKKILEMCMICVEDFEKNDEQGAIHFESFYLTERALFRISNWALSMGWENPFDPENLEDIQDVMLHGGFIGIFQEREYNGKKRVEIKWFNKSSKKRADNGSIEFTDSELDIIKQGEKAYPKMIQYRKDNYGHEYLSGGGALNNDSDESYDELPF